ncbi:MBL fold metallo-hydrolase [Ramlibacter sp. MAHUQ-53]|uniref:MBL fold metallo-hydrolase n=1 Tax=unclassified Ramlibacter TaxID=2617605 RepID=UPI00363B6E87
MPPPPSTLDYPFADRQPEPATTIEVAPGVRWIRMGLPFALDHINLWLLRDTLDGREGWTVVDTGIHHADTRAQWEQLFAGEMQGLPVLRVVVTHMHPDHVGFAHALCERWQCELWISALDYYAACTGTAGLAGFGGEATARFFASHGLADAEVLALVRSREGHYASLVPALPPRFRRLSDGATLRIGGRDWLCISGQGHSPDHMALYCGELGVLVSGDMVLPRISTNISVYDIEPEADPLTAFLASLQKFLALPAATLVLPSHGRPFTGLHARVGQLLAHHEERLAEVLAACRARPHTAVDMLPVLFRRTLDAQQTLFALGESLAHLHALRGQGRLRRRRGEDGAWRFEAA